MKQTLVYTPSPLMLAAAGIMITVIVATLLLLRFLPVQTSRSRIRKCPSCGSTRIDLYMGGYLGKIYSCPDCDYRGPVVLEFEIPQEATRSKSKSKSKSSASAE